MHDSSETSYEKEYHKQAMLSISQLMNFNIFI